MAKHYVFFTRNVLPKPRADLVQVVNCANAAANLGYSTVLTCLAENTNSLNPANVLFPFCPKLPERSLAEFYNIQDKLKVCALPVPWPLGQTRNKWTNVSTVVCKYYLPVHIRPTTKIIHTRDWNFVKAAIQCGIPAIYEHHHYEKKIFEPNVVHHPLFQIAVTVADSVRENMIHYGMPPEKVIKLHNGFNQLFAIRHPQAAAIWREKLLNTKYQHLIVYSGGLNQFKGVDLLIDSAKNLPHACIAFAGGDADKVDYYQALSQKKQLQNTTFLGHLPQEQLASLLQAADVLVHPHCSGKEAMFTSPLKFFDYIASGTPIVATEIPTLMEFQSTGVVAGWCEPDNPVQLTHCIKRVLETHPRKPEGYLDEIGFVHQFSWESRIRKILSYVDASIRPLPTEL